MLIGEPLIQNLLGASIGFQDPWRSLPFLSVGVSPHPSPIANKNVYSNALYAAFSFNEPDLYLCNSAFLVDSEEGPVADLRANSHRGRTRCFNPSPWW